MIHFEGTAETNQMLRHIDEVMSDRLDDVSYSDEDQTVVDRIGHMGQEPGSCLVLTGADLDARETDALMRKVIRAEVENWVADASQRLIHRAMLALEYHPGGYILTDQPDCGAEFSWHALVRFWLVGDTYMRCVTCGHLYKD